MHDSKNISADRLCALFSQARLNGYTSLDEHEANIALIGSISSRLCVLELIIRNLTYQILQSQNPQWFETLPKTIRISKDKNKKYLTREELIFSQTLGFWVVVVNHHKIHNKIFDRDFLDNLDFRKYHIKNKNRFNRHIRLMDYHKAKAILHLFHLIRNRSFHIENLYKFVNNGYPRLNVKIENAHKEIVYIAIEPNKIIEFLNDLIASYDKDLIGYGEK